MLDEAKIILQHKYIIIQSIYTGTHVTCRQELNERLLLAVWWWQLPLGISRRRNNTRRPLRQRPMRPRQTRRTWSTATAPWPDSAATGRGGDESAGVRLFLDTWTSRRPASQRANGKLTSAQPLKDGGLRHQSERRRWHRWVTIWREISLNARQNWTSARRRPVQRCWRRSIGLGQWDNPVALWDDANPIS